MYSRSLYKSLRCLIVASLTASFKYLLIAISILVVAFVALASSWYCTKKPFKIRARELRGQIMEGLRLRPRSGSTTMV